MWHELNPFGRLIQAFWFTSRPQTPSVAALDRARRTLKRFDRCTYYKPPFGYGYKRYKSSIVLLQHSAQESVDMKHKVAPRCLTLERATSKRTILGKDERRRFAHQTKHKNTGNIGKVNFSQRQAPPYLVSSHLVLWANFHFCQCCKSW